MATSVVTPMPQTPPPAAPPEPQDPAAQAQSPAPRPSRRKESTHVEKMNAARNISLEGLIDSTPARTMPAIDVPVAEDTPVEGQPRNEKGQFAAQEPEDGQDTQPEGIYTEFPVEELQRIAQEEGLDLTKIEDVNAAERFYKRELRLKGTPAPADGQVPDGVPDLAVRMTAFEKELLAKAQPPPAQAAPPAQPPVQAPPQQQQVQQPQQFAPSTQAQYPKLQDIGASWNSSADAINAEMQEYEGINQQIAAGIKPDFSRLQQIRDAQVNRQILAQMPILAQVVQQLFQQALPSVMEERLAPVMEKLNPLESAYHGQRLNEAARSAVSDLESEAEFKDIGEMMKPLSKNMLTFSEGGSTIKVADTPMNRIFIQNPALLRIEIPPSPERGIDAYAAHRLTLTEQYRQAHALYRAKRPNPQAAMTLIQAGAQQQQRSNLEQTRQRMNAGTPGGNGGSQGPASFVQSLNSKGGTVSGRRLEDLV